MAIVSVRKTATDPRWPWEVRTVGCSGETVEECYDAGIGCGNCDQYKTFEGAIKNIDSYLPDASTYLMMKNF